MATADIFDLDGFDMKQINDDLARFSSEVMLWRSTKEDAPDVKASVPAVDCCVICNAPISLGFIAPGRRLPMVYMHPQSSRRMHIQCMCWAAKSWAPHEKSMNRFVDQYANVHCEVCQGPFADTPCVTCVADNPKRSERSLPHIHIACIAGSEWPILRTTDLDNFYAHCPECGEWPDRTKMVIRGQKMNPDAFTLPGYVNFDYESDSDNDVKIIERSVERAAAPAAAAAAPASLMMMDSKHVSQPTPGLSDQQALAAANSVVYPPRILSNCVRARCPLRSASDTAAELPFAIPLPDQIRMNDLAVILLGATIEHTFGMRDQTRFAILTGSDKRYRLCAERRESELHVRGGEIESMLGQKITHVLFDRSTIWWVGFRTANNVECWADSSCMIECRELPAPEPVADVPDTIVTIAATPSVGPLPPSVDSLLALMPPETPAYEPMPLPVVFDPIRSDAEMAEVKTVKCIVMESVQSEAETHLLEAVANIETVSVDTVVSAFASPSRKRKRATDANKTAPKKPRMSRELELLTRPFNHAGNRDLAAASKKKRVR